MKYFIVRKLGSNLKTGERMYLYLIVDSTNRSGLWERNINEAINNYKECNEKKLFVWKNGAEIITVENLFDYIKEQNRDKYTLVKELDSLYSEKTLLKKYPELFI